MVTLRKIQPAERTAVLVMNAGLRLTLCPVFAKCDGVLLVEPDGSRGYHPNTEGTARSLTDLVLNTRTERLLCGFIATAEKEVLQAAGIDIRVGSCACAVDELVSSFSTLPQV